MLSLEDRTALRDLLERYCWANDAGDARGVAETFAVDGVYDSFGDVFQGRAAIQRLFEERVAARSGQPIANPQHWLGNVVIDGDTDTATSRSYFMRVAQSPDAAKPVLLASGWYADRLRRGAGGWEITHRVVSRHLPSSPP